LFVLSHYQQMATNN